MKVIEVIGDSMTPTLKHGQLVITVDQELQEISRFNIITLNLFDKTMIKRLIGYPGEHLRITHSGLKVDGMLFSNEKLLGRNNITHLEGLEIDLAEDEIYILGDNPNNSLDSRKLGPVDANRILGRVRFRLWPPRIL